MNKNTSCWNCKYRNWFDGKCHHPEALVYVDQDGKKYFRSTYLERQSWSSCGINAKNYKSNFKGKINDWYSKILRKLQTLHY